MGDILLRLGVLEMRMQITGDQRHPVYTFIKDHNHLRREYQVLLKPKVDDLQRQIHQDKKFAPPLVQQKAKDP